jgi:lipopolysaccharide export system protein LptC
LTSISLADAQRETRFPARSRADSERTYRRAMRHSRWVRWLRAALLLTIAVVLFGLVIENYLPVGGLRLPAEIGKLVIKGSTVIMQEPRLTGYTTDGRPYEFTANAAQQDITKPDLVELLQIRAKIDMADKSTVHLSADTGVYNMKTDILKLHDNIHLVSSTGYEARLSEAAVDMNKGNVVSDSPVWVKLLDGDLTAKRLEIIDKGDVVRFTDVTMMLQSGKPKQTKAAQQ